MKTFLICLEKRKNNIFSIKKKRRNLDVSYQLFFLFIFCWGTKHFASLTFIKLEIFLLPLRFYLSPFSYNLDFHHSRQSGHWCVFRDTFFRKRAFCLLVLPKQMPFLTISNENIFFKTQGNRLGAIVAPNKRLE